MKALILVLLFFTTKTWGQSSSQVYTTDPPPTRPVMADLVRDVRRPLVEKLREVQNSFVPNEINGRFYFTSSIDQLCNFDFGWAGAGSRVVEVNVVTTRPDANTIDEIISYKACDREFLREQVIRRGSNLTPTTVPDIFQGKIPLQMSENIERITYRLAGFENPMFELDVQNYRNGYQFESRFYVQGDEALTFLERFEADRFVGQYEHTNMLFDWPIVGQSLDIHRNDRLRIIKRDDRFNPLYFSSYTTPISEKAFANKVVQWTAEGGYFSSLGLFFNVVISVLPKTEQASLGVGANQKAIEKFTQLIGLLQSRTPVDIQTVQNELIEIRDKLRENTYTCEGFE